MIAIALVLHAIITFCNGTGAHVAKKKNRISLLTDDDEAFRYLLRTPPVSFLVLHFLCFFVCTFILPLENQESRGVYLDLPVEGDLPIIFVLYDGCPHLLSSFQLYEYSSVFHGHPLPPPVNDECGTLASRL